MWSKIWDFLLLVFFVTALAVLTYMAFVALAVIFTILAACLYWMIEHIGDVIPMLGDLFRGITGS